MKLKPAVNEARRDYLVARQSTRAIFVRRRLLQLARRSVARLAYFHNRDSEEHPQLHGP